MRSPTRCFWVSLALAAWVFASRAWLIHLWGSPLPYLDQWDAEAALYRSWLADTLTWRDLFAAHNEHRIALTRAADLCLFELCGGWNLWAQMLLNASLHAASGGVLCHAFLTRIAHGMRIVFVVGLAVFFAVPSGWQNALWGFQSQVYFTHLLAIAAFAALSVLPIGKRERWFAWSALALGLFGNAAGTLAAVAALLLAWPARRDRGGWIAFGAAATLVVFGFLLAVPAPHHAALQAQDVSQFLGVLVRGLGWPHVGSAFAWVALQAPLAALCLLRFRARQPLSSGDRLAVALALFSALQAAAVAYSRGAGLVDLEPLSRYQDAFLLAAAAQLYAACQLAANYGRRGRLALVGWLGLMAIGLLQLTTTNLSVHLPFKRASDRINLAAMRTYLAHPDEVAFRENVRHLGLEAAYVLQVLNDPVLRPYLPRELTSEVPPPWLVRHAGACWTIATLTLIAALANTRRITSNGPNPSMPPQTRPQ